MGSGHILVYAFDVLMQIYLSQGYLERDAAGLIIEKNLYGADIDKRAYQLAYFSLMMSARSHDRRFFGRGIKPNLCNFKDLSEINADNLTGKLKAFAEQFENADTYGSLLEVGSFKTDEIAELIEKYDENLYTMGYKDILSEMLTAYKILSQKYDVVVTNPPYMGGSGMNAKLSEFVKNKYFDSKSDLFAVFIERCSAFAKQTGFFAMITQHAFMFLSSYEKLRERLLMKTTINMAHLGARAFDEIGGEVVQTTSFVNFNSHIKEYKGTYARLVDVNGEAEKEKLFLSGENRNVANQENFSKIPGAPVAYWVSENFIRAFERGISLGKIAYPKKGLDTADNNRFVRMWYEPSVKVIGFPAYFNEPFFKSMKWFPLNSGGNFRKWYGNFDKVINWENEGEEIKQFPKAFIRAKDFYFQESLSWTKISSSKFGIRYTPRGFIFDSAGQSIFDTKGMLYYLLGYMCTNISFDILKMLNPTLNYQVGDIANVPVIISEKNKLLIESIVKQNITLSKTDWDSFETSWDFERHPLI